MLQNRQFSRGSNGFTLIELLVVIAIIAILAAILFPVFAQAREKARAITCVSNQKQMGLAVVQYLQDYDELMPMVEYCENGIPQSQLPNYCVVGNTSYMTTWVKAIQPYMKTYDTTQCPDNTKNPFGEVIPPKAGYLAEVIFPTESFNYLYLNPDYECDNPFGDVVPWGMPAMLAQIEEPAATVLFADAKIVGADAIGYYSGVGVEAPATAGLSSYACAYNNSGWGLGTWGDDPTFSDNPINGTGNFIARHTQGGNVAFCDGHAKWYTPGGLAVGTNWTPTTLNTNINITDLTQYLWSLRKSGASDLDSSDL